MRMQITVDNLTTSKALAILSALETAEALHETDVDVSVLPVSRSDRTGVVTLAEALANSPEYVEAALDASFEEPEEPEEPEETLEEAAEGDLVEPVKKKKKYPGYRPQPIVGVPLLGRTVRSRLVPLTVAQQALGWKQGRLGYMVTTGTIETIQELHGAVIFHFLTPEQLSILRLAESLASTQGKRRYSRRLLQQATQLWQRSRAAA